VTTWSTHSEQVCLYSNSDIRRDFTLQFTSPWLETNLEFSGICQRFCSFTGNVHHPITLSEIDVLRRLRNLQVAFFWCSLTGNVHQPITLSEIDIAVLAIQLPLSVEVLDPITVMLASRLRRCVFPLPLTHRPIWPVKSQLIFTYFMWSSIAVALFP